MMVKNIHLGYTGEIMKALTGTQSNQIKVKTSKPVTIVKKLPAASGSRRLAKK